MINYLYSKFLYIYYFSKEYSKYYYNLYLYNNINILYYNYIYPLTKNNNYLQIIY